MITLYRKLFVYNMYTSFAYNIIIRYLRVRECTRLYTAHTMTTASDTCSSTYIHLADSPSNAILPTYCNAIIIIIICRIVSLSVFFLLFLCDRIFSTRLSSLQPSRILSIHYIIMCVHFTYQFVRVDVCVCVRASAGGVLPSSLFSFFFHSVRSSRFIPLSHIDDEPSHARTHVGTRLSPVCTYQLYTHTYLPYTSRTIII